MCDQKQKQRTKWTKLTHTEDRLVFARGRGWGLGEIGGRDQKVHTSSYKINNSWGYNVQHDDYITNPVYLKVSKSESWKSSSQEKMFVTMHGDGY